jgi:AcrR family transcriptional regulator
MANLVSDSFSGNVPGEPGLRDRKKAKRRDEIIAVARDLFARNGIDATTMTDIAAAVGISSPTVFNYFGSKDGILIALISEGTLQAREGDRDLHWQAGRTMAELILTLFLRVSDRTLDIAGKRVWRYAEAATIRRPETEFSRQYSEVSQALVVVVAEFFAGMDLRMRSGAVGDPAYLAQLFHDVWVPCFLQLITDETQTLADHEAMLRARILPLVDLVFDPASAQFPLRKGSVQ